MIQRIQNLYLLFSLVLLVLILFIPLAEFLINEQVFQFYASGIKELNAEKSGFLITTYPMLIIYIIIIILTLITMFLYKNRSLQMRLCRLNIMLILGSFFLYAFYIYRMVSNESAVWNISYAIFIPLITIVLFYLALKGIKKDADLIKSINRIR